MSVAPVMPVDLSDPATFAVGTCPSPGPPAPQFIGAV
jgi:hypothetical protein